MAGLGGSAGTEDMAGFGGSACTEDRASFELMVQLALKTCWDGLEQSACCEPSWHTAQCWFSGVWQQAHRTPYCYLFLLILTGISAEKNSTENEKVDFFNMLLLFLML